jgi:hypothetical protein
MNNINYPILTEFTVDTNPPKDLALSDPVLCFNNSNEWIIIEIDLLLKTPIIWTKIYTENKAKDVSIVLCPRTLRASVFDGKLKSLKYDDETLILEKEDKSLIPIDLNVSIDTESNLEINKRYQVSIQTLRNSLVDYYDIKYLHPNKKTSKYIINKNYLKNRLDEYDQEIIMDTEHLSYHPKTLVHIIQYLSDKGTRKITLLIGNDSTNIESLGYDNKKSGYDSYILNYENKIIEKDSFIMPILYYKALKIYPNSKKIIL